MDTMTESMTMMDEVHVTGKAFSAALANWDGEELQGEIIAEIVRQHLTPESRAMLAFQVLVNGSRGEDALSTEDKLFAVNLAETMGPDWCQWLYRFAVLCTKVA